MRNAEGEESSRVLWVTMRPVERTFCCREEVTQYGKGNQREKNKRQDHSREVLRASTLFRLGELKRDTSPRGGRMGKLCGMSMT